MDKRKIRKLAFSPLVYLLLAVAGTVAFVINAADHTTNVPEGLERLGTAIMAGILWLAAALLHLNTKP